jgi:hypothetical protein
MSKAGFSTWKKLMNSLIYYLFFGISNANAGGYRIKCRDGMEFVYTGKASNYSPQDLCQDHGGLTSHKISDAPSTKKDSFDFGISAWLTPYALKPVYTHEGYVERDDYLYFEIGRKYNRHYSAGMTLEARYAYIDFGITSYAGNTAFYPVYTGSDYTATESELYSYSNVIPSSNVFGGTYSSGLSLPFIFRKDYKFAAFAGSTYEHSFFMNTNGNTLATSVGLRTSIKKAFIEAVSTDTFRSFDFVPQQLYAGYDPSISFKIGLNIK